MKVLILGSTGLLGQALKKTSIDYGYQTFCLARKNAQINLDATCKEKLNKVIDDISPDIIVNSIAMTNLQECEANPKKANIVNTEIPRFIASKCMNMREKKIRFIQISTDHFFTGDGNKLHDEEAPVRCLNQYSKSKYDGETFVKKIHNALIIRTNIVGFRNWKESPTFLEWVISNLKSKIPITVFNDFYTSSIDVMNCSKAIFELEKLNASGIYNVGSRDCVSKARFIQMISTELKIDFLNNVSQGSIHDLKGVVRADSLGLDVKKAEALLNYELPTSQEVVSCLIKTYIKNSKI